MSSWQIRAAAFYGLMGLLLILSVTQTLKVLLPSGVSSQIGHNSEAYLVALMLGVILQWVRPAAQILARPWIPLAVLGVALFAVGLGLEISKDQLSSSVVTLNEAFFALSAISFYLIPRRPLALAPYLAVGLLVAMVAFNRTDFVTSQAESLVAVMLAPVSFDIADPTLVDRHAADRPRARLIWCVVLLVVPAVFVALFHVHLTGIPTEIARYGRRPTEAFLAFFFIHLYFSYLLGEGWRRSTALADPAAHPPIGV